VIPLPAGYPLHVGFPLLLASHVLLDHELLDMATHYDSKYDVTTELRIDAAGSATFHVAGNVTSKGAELTPGARTAMSEHVTRVDDTWQGHAVAQALPEYMRVPTYLSAPAVALREEAAARGGADHRSNITTLHLSR